MAKLKEKFKFRLDGCVQVMGTKMFPLPSKSNVFYYNNEVTNPIEDEQILKVLDSLEFKEGFCYQNSNKIVKALEQIGVDAEFYAGWLFYMSDYPVHHSWVVIDDKFVIDMSVNVLAFKEYKKECEANEPDSMDEARRLLIEVNERVEQNNENSQLGVAGEVPEFAFYIGGKSTPYKARKNFNDMIDQLADEHPTYSRDGMNPHGRSKIQQMRQEK